MKKGSPRRERIALGMPAPSSRAVKRTLYAFLITAHSFVRWAILASCAATVAHALQGWISGRVWRPADQRIALNIRVLGG